MAESDTDPEYGPTTNVSSLTGKRERDGTLKAVELRVEYFESREVEPEVFEFRNECEADLRYDVTDGVASLARVSDHSDGMHGGGANSTAPALLRTLPAGERAVESGPVSSASNAPRRRLARPSRTVARSSMENDNT